MDAVIMRRDWDPFPPNILESVKVTIFSDSFSSQTLYMLFFSQKCDEESGGWTGGQMFLHVLGLSIFIRNSNIRSKVGEKVLIRM